MAKTNTLYQETYRCQKCGSHRIINRSAKKKINHVKHMMCTHCNKLKSVFIKVG